MSAPGTASQYPADSHHKTGKRSVTFESIEHILRTGGDMATGRPEERRYGIPVEKYRQGKYKG